MFNNSKYTTWYNDLITTAKMKNRTRGDGTYYENHHIIPRSLGGNNSKENLVMLTSKEHYICHLLLPKMCIDPNHKHKLSQAYIIMATGGNNDQKPKRHTSRLYSLFRDAYAQHIGGENSYMFGVPKDLEYRKKISATRKAKGLAAGEKNPMHGKKHSEESKRKMATIKRQRIQERGEDFHKDRARLANPRSRKVMTDDGALFDSLRQASLSNGFADVGAGRRRIADGRWKYL